MKPVEGLKVSKPPLHEKLSKAATVYMTEDKGPFRCGNCDWYHTNNTCELVEGKIMAGDCCNLYEKKD